MTVDRNNRLAVLAAEIVAAHTDSLKATATAVARAIDAGHLLKEAKADLPHGSWLPWLRRSVGFSARTAQGYIRLAKLSAADAQRVAHLGVRKALREIGDGETAPAENSCTDWLVELATLWTKGSPALRLRALQHLQRKGEFRATSPQELREIVARGVLHDLDDPGWFIRAAVTRGQQ